ncbi:mismatch-specific DNA-glycosylase [Aeromicrobium wangtongii]|uniref:Mismatch-specific DNA-glycosylase n=1 Tax=Aeromicrobium wangtongii TaxID=2969247 RepID=A0ABY5M9P6_9ACTN|nr:mismatch-specific DNA-glycosylase [Aeromicrobium wangtongii]MCD9200123.1 mismatch-specific DNA-glycosylase [Aeromicrobium wangtongii]UUP13378.1 mismatch-specific DNA-glycosylase [Aeromicrobium wangtongii]
MDVLDDIWTPGIELAICGTAVGPCAAERGHHYAQRGNAFWRLLNDSGLTPTLLTPGDEVRLPDLGIGLIDVVRRFDPPDPFDVDTFATALDRAAPRWIAFNGRVGADAVARTLGEPRPALGRQRWTFAGARVFVLPSSSGANQRKDHGGRSDRLSWWAELAALVADRAVVRS